jgi:hypothetical protein
LRVGDNHDYAQLAGMENANVREYNVVLWVLRPGAALSFYVGGGDSDGGALSDDATRIGSVYEDLRSFAQRRQSRLLWGVLNNFVLGRHY